MGILHSLSGTMVVNEVTVRTCHVHYEELESSPYIFHTGSDGEQQMSPVSTTQGQGERSCSADSDHVLPRPADKIIKATRRGTACRSRNTRLGHTE